MARVNRFQQPEVLAQNLMAKGVSHDATHRVNIDGAHMGRSIVLSKGGGRLTTRAFGPSKLFFCQSTVDIVEEIIAGDGGRVTDKVFIDDWLRLALRNLAPGRTLDIKDAVVCNNGQTRITVDDQTRVIVHATRTKEELVLSR